jgi:hypothetical protein
MGRVTRSLLWVLVFQMTFLLELQAREKHKPHSLFCLRSVDGTWHAQTFQPLINPRKELFFAEISFEAQHVDVVRLRHFYPGYDVEFDYKFDTNGRLNGLMGSVAVPKDWVAEADLFTHLDAPDTALKIRYYRPGTEDRILAPEGVNTYIADLSNAPIYKTPESLPCAGSFQDAEKMNATQK